MQPERRKAPRVAFIALLIPVASLIGWALAGGGGLPPLWFHLPLTIAAGTWAGWRIVR
jgi:fatty acid desaturase